MDKKEYVLVKTIKRSATLNLGERTMKRPEDVTIRKRDDRGEEEYEHRAKGMPAELAAAIAVEISTDRHREDHSLPAKTDAPGSGRTRDRAGSMWF